MTHSVEYSAGIEAYRRVDTRLAIGRIPLSTCLEIAEPYSDKDDLTPDTALDLAWLRLETGLAMMREPDPQTELTHTPKQVSKVLEESRVDFRRVIKNESAPTVLRAKAMIGQAGVGLYAEANSERPPALSKQHLPYLKAIQATAQLMLKQPQPVREEAAFMDTLVPHYILGELMARTAWILPASPRQPWSITLISREKISKPAVGLVVASEPRSDVVTITPDMLGNSIWGDEDKQIAIGMRKAATKSQGVETAFGTLQAIAKFRGVGFGTKLMFTSTFETLIFDALSNQMVARLNEFKLPSEAVAPASTAPKEAPLLTEVKWYDAQSSEYVHDLPRATFNLNLETLEAHAARSTLAPAELHSLGWMQIDHGRMLLLQANEEQAAAANARKTASQLSRLEAPEQLKIAQAAEEKAAQLAAQAPERFDAALANFLQAAAEAAANKAYGDASEILLDIDSHPLYKALYTGSKPEDLQRLTDTYVRRLAASYLKLREYERLAKKDTDPEQSDTVHAAAMRGAFCLLVSGVTDEASRHLALTASTRTGGSRGEMDAVIFPYNYLTGGYDVETPVHIKLLSGNDITVQKGYVTVGFERMAPKGSAFSFYSKLASAARATKKSGVSKKDVRSNDIDILALEISDAVADASA